MRCLCGQIYIDRKSLLQRTSKLFRLKRMVSVGNSDREILAALIMAEENEDIINKILEMALMMANKKTNAPQ